MCGTGKKEFECELDAEEHAEEIRKKHPEDTERLHSYFCAYCLRWHIGNKPVRLTRNQRKHRNNQ